MTERQNVKKKAIEPVGPFAPPKPSEVDETERGEPMAVANDKQTTEGEAFAPTTAPKLPGPRAESRRAESPRGYTQPDAQGFAHPDLDREDEDAPSASVAANLPRDAEDDEDEARGS